MASSVSGQDESNPVRCDWLPERARWSDLARSGLAALSRKKNFPNRHIINPLLTKLVRSRWLDIIGLVLFCVFMDLDSVSVHKHAKKELGQYPAILTWSISHASYPCYLEFLIYFPLCSRFEDQNYTLFTFSWLLGNSSVHMCSP